MFVIPGEISIALEADNAADHLAQAIDTVQRYLDDGYEIISWSAHCNNDQQIAEVTLRINARFTEPDLDDVEELPIDLSGSTGCDCGCP